MTNILLRLLSTVLVVSSLSGCNDEKLLENITQEQANQVLTVLQQHNIDAHKQGALKSGYTITVAPSERTAALSVINEYQLPWSAEVQINQAFANSSLVASPNAEQAKVLSLEEQRLEQSLRIIDKVVNARVHISYPLLSDSLDNHVSPEHVGVLITYKGALDDDIFIPQIKSLIKNSLTNVDYENIAVVLFPSPVIQHSPPISDRHPMESIWISVLVLIAVAMIITGGYVAYKIRQKSVVSAVDTDMQDKNKMKESTTS